MRDLFFNFSKAPWYIKSIKQFKKMSRDDTGGHRFNEFKLYPILRDRDATAGTVDLYLTQDLWAAQKISKLSKEETHFDIGSRVDGFITHLLSFRDNITLIDIRPLPYFIDEGLDFIQADATNLDNIKDDSVFSLSALCSLEHFGLGRYGDPIDPQACFRAFKAIQRVLKPGGILYLSLPIGRERIEYNAHRIFFPNTVIDCFDNMELIEFSVATADPKKPLIENPGIHDFDEAEHYFGLFEFIKR